MDLPVHSHDLIDTLDEQFPEVIYRSDTDREEFLMRMGERRLVLMLKRLRATELERTRDPHFDRMEQD